MIGFLLSTCQELDQPYACRGFIIFMKLKSSKSYLTRKHNQNQVLDQSSSVGINMDEYFTKLHKYEIDFMTTLVNNCFKENKVKLNA